MHIFRLIAVAGVFICGLPAQWLNNKTPNVPRLPDGKPNLTAPAPRLANGKPDLSGIWDADRTYLVNLAKDLKPGDVQMQPWAEAIYKERAAGLHAHEEPDANCLPQGVPKIDAAPVPWKIVQLPNEIVILYEAFTQFRQIHMDGRKLPVDPNPTWLGYSVGHWEGDTLVVESSGFNGKAWLDQSGHPATEKLKVTEKFHRRDFGHMDLEITIDDPGAYLKPWTAKESPKLAVDTELIEFVCAENEQDIKHMVTKK